MKTLFSHLLTGLSAASLIMRRHQMIKHSLITIFADTTPGGPLDVLLQENGSALLQEDGTYIILE